MRVLFTMRLGHANVVANYGEYIPGLVTQCIWAGLTLIYIGIFGWQWVVSLETGSMLGLMMTSMIMNVVILISFSVILCFVPLIEPFADFP